MATQYQKRMMVRKTSDLTRLADQYKQNIEAITGQYESEFSNWQKQRDELMAPYEAAVKKYKEVDVPNYESAASAYRQRLDAFNQRLSDYEANPTKVKKEAYKIINYYGNGIWSLQPKGINDVVFWNDASLLQEIKSGNLSKSGGANLSRGDVIYTQENAPVPTFNEKAPTAPTAPTKPDVPEFDASQFEQSKTQLQTSFQRDIGARKDARLAAVGRKASRPLLQGA